MKKNSLVLDCRMISSSGIGTYIKNLLSGLVNDKRFTLNLLYYQKDKKYLPTGANLIGMKSPIYSIQEQIEWLAKIPKCSVFFSPHFNIPLLPIRAKKRITVIHDVYHLAHYSQLPILQKIYAKMMYNGASLLSDLVITVSQFSKREINKYIRIRPKDLKVVLNGIKLNSQMVELEAIQKKYQLPSSFVLAIGNVKAHKNLSRLFEAYENDIVVVGKKEGFITGVDLKRRSNIHFVGQVLDEEVPAFYKLAKALVFPSLYEGFGYPPLEAMSVGCPVVASNRGSILEICQDAAILVDPLDVASIREGILKSLSEKKEEFILKGFAHVKNYDQKERVKELIDVIYQNCNSENL